MLTNFKLYNDKKNRKLIVNQFYSNLNHENIHDAVISLEERKHQAFPQGEVYFQNDLPEELQNELKLSKSDGLFIIKEDNIQKGAVIPLQLIVQYLVANRTRIVEEKELSVIQLENIIDRLELTLQTESL